MKIIIPGGTGQVGTLLARRFHDNGDEVVTLGRHQASAPWRTVLWDGRTLGPWAEEIDGADVVINLAGRSVNCRYTPENRAEIMNSRVDSTRVVGEAIARAARPPRTWLQASTATIYVHRFDAPNDEESGIIGGGEPDAPDTWRFSIDVARAWERVLHEADTPGTRKVELRAAMVMSPDADGVFDTLVGLVRRGLGGRAGSGRQYVSWVHYLDFLNAIDWLVTHEEVTGPVNIASPAPLPNAAFMAALRRACGVSIGLPAAEWMLEIGACVMGTETELLLKSRRVIPGRLLKMGFTFLHPDWEEASRDLVREWRALRA